MQKFTSRDLRIFASGEWYRLSEELLDEIKTAVAKDENIAAKVEVFSGLLAQDDIDLRQRVADRAYLINALDRGGYSARADAIVADTIRILRASKRTAELASAFIEFGLEMQHCGRTLEARNCFVEALHLITSEANSERRQFELLTELAAVLRTTDSYDLAEQCEVKLAELRQDSRANEQNEALRPEGKSASQMQFEAYLNWLLGFTHSKILSWSEDDRQLAEPLLKSLLGATRENRYPQLGDSRELWKQLISAGLARGPKRVDNTTQADVETWIDCGDTLREHLPDEPEFQEAFAQEIICFSQQLEQLDPFIQQIAKLNLACWDSAAIARQTGHPQSMVELALEQTKTLAIQR